MTEKHGSPMPMPMGGPQFGPVATTFASQLETVREIVKLRWPPPIFIPYKRKSQAAMTAEEQERFLCAYSMLIASPAPFGWLGPYVDIHDMDIAVGMHCQHGTQRFLPWHRIYLVLLERQLRTIHPDVTIPYWDWTVDRAIPSWVASYTPTVTTPAQGAITVTRAPGNPSFLPTAAEIGGVLGHRRLSHVYDQSRGISRRRACLGGRHDGLHSQRALRSDFLHAPRQYRSALEPVAGGQSGQESQPARPQPRSELAANGPVGL